MPWYQSHPGRLNIIGKRSKLEVRRNFYSQRVLVDSWNGLSRETKLAKKRCRIQMKTQYREQALM